MTMSHDHATAGASIPALVLAGLGRDRLLQFGAVLVQFGLLAVVIWKYELQSPIILNLLTLVWAGIAINHFLPAALRMPFFATVSIGALAIVFNVQESWDVVAWLVGMSLGLIGIAHLPVPFIARVGLLVAAAVGLGYFRVWPDAPEGLGAIWPIIGSMFMFRMFIYMYDLKHHAAPFSLSRSLAYFFMVPNAFFPLFPVVDYKTFCRSHYGGEDLAIYQKGIEWIFRGVFHLLLYRVMYQNLMIPLDQVANSGDAAQYMTTTFLRYLKVSGNFHIILGIICLFGFNLPDAFNRYLLATSFTDFWRRINIYWKDFMQKVVFNPTFYAIKKSVGMTGAMLIATAAAFLATWALHGYQEYWLAGRFKFEAQDAWYWGVLGGAMVANVYLENRFGRKRSLGKTKRRIGEDISLALRTMTMFAVLIGIWNVWSCDDLGELGALADAFKTTSALQILGILGGLSVIGVAAILSHRFPRMDKLKGKPGQGPNLYYFWRSVVLRVGVAGVILVVAKWPLILAPVSQDFAAAVHRLRDSRLNAQDTELLEKGYYEDLLVVTRFNPELAELYAERPANWNVNPTVAPAEPGVYPPYKLLPSMDVEYKGVRMTTNRWGMRDREYEKAKAPGTYRIALIGGSHVVGVGVLNDETFDNVLEDMLNAQNLDSTITRFEVLNFSISGFGPMSCTATLEQRILEWEPDMFLYGAIKDDDAFVIELANAIDKDLNLPFPHVNEMVAAAGIEPNTPRIVGERKVRPLVEGLLGPLYDRMVTVCRDNGIVPVASFLPRPKDTSAEQAEIDRQIELAREAGFVMVDTSDAFAGVADLNTLLIAAWDLHPNVQGHQLLAESVHQAIVPVIERDAAESNQP